ncbi:MAG: ribonuclease III domain-containing protein [Bacillota bacterium]|nr:ribonuclease III domain-containing protein [Bacillota bacterium]
MTDFFTTSLSDNEIDRYSVLSLAYIGDGVFELMTRTHLALLGNTTSFGLHKKTTGIVCAASQAKAARAIRNELREDEAAIFLRGRNQKPKSIPKHAETADYYYATALEALFGWLFLKGRGERLNELFQSVIKACGDQKKECAD